MGPGNGLVILAVLSQHVLQRYYGYAVISVDGTALDMRYQINPNNKIIE